MKRAKGEVDGMGRGGRGGRSPTPNDDRSRSMNYQDPVGQAAMANEARQRGDDDWDDGYDDDVQSEGVVVEESKDDNAHWGIYRDEPRKREVWRDFDPFEHFGYDWNNLKAKPKSKDE